MKRNEIAGFSNVVVMFAISVFCAISISGQTPTAVDPTSYGWTSGRFAANVAALFGLIGVVIGGLALARPKGLFGTASGRLGAIVALVTGLTGLALGGLVVVNSGGSIGTGGGMLGGIIALALGLIATVLGGLAMSRSHRAD